MLGVGRRAAAALRGVVLGHFVSAVFGGAEGGVLELGRAGVFPRTAGPLWRLGRRGLAVVAWVLHPVLIFVLSLLLLSEWMA